jgi:hypothetical protein
MVKPKKSTAKAPENRGRRGLSGQHGTGERSPFVGVRLASEELGEIDALAQQHGVKRSEMIRRLLDAGREALGRK